MGNRPGPQDRTQWALGLACAAAGGVGLAIHARSYLPFFADDSFISLQYSKRLLAGDGLTFADGEWVEGYSNLLWVLVVAAGGAVGLDLVDAARVFGFGFMFIALVVVSIRHWDKTAVSAVAIAGFLAGSGSIAVWAVGGLEQGLVACLLAVAFASSWPLLEEKPTTAQIAIPSLALAALCITRPDGPLFSVALGLGLLGARRDRNAVVTVAKLAVFPALFVAAQLGFRLFYYGEMLPNTAHVKLGLGIDEGLLWMGNGLLNHLAMAVAAAMALVAWSDREARARLLLVAPAVVLWTTYVVAVGGDIFPGRRHLVPLVVLLAFPIGEGFRWVAHRNRVAAWAVALLLVPTHAWLQSQDGENRRANRERWEWDCAVTGTLLAKAFGEADPLLAAGAAGCMPYFSGLNTIDLWGLNDRYLATHPLEGRKSRLGHRMGDLRYVISREPDLLQFGGVKGDRRLRTAMGKQFAKDPRFEKRYRAVTFEGRDPHVFRAHLWVRLDGPIGIQRSPGQVEVPAYLLSHRKQTVARLDDDGQLGIEVSQGNPAQLRGLRLDASKDWSVNVEATGGTVMARIGPDGQLLVRATSGDAFVRRIVLSEVGRR